MISTRKLFLLLHFYKSILFLNLGLFLIGLLLDANSFFSIFCFFGLIVSFLFKEKYRNHEYFFYYNNGLTKLQLYGFCFCLNIIIGVFVNCVL